MMTTTEPLKIPVPKPLPTQHLIDSFQPAPAGWRAYYLDQEASRVCAVVVEIWALVEYEPEDNPEDAEDTDLLQELRHFTATSTGAFVDLLDLPYQLICVLGPSTPDHVAVVRQHLAISGLGVRVDSITMPNTN